VAEGGRCTATFSEQARLTLFCHDSKHPHEAEQGILRYGDPFHVDQEGRNIEKVRRRSLHCQVNMKTRSVSLTGTKTEKMERGSQSFKKPQPPLTVPATNERVTESGREGGRRDSGG
jgi:hypothetical protein